MKVMMHLCSRKTRNFPCLGSSAHEEAPQVDCPVDGKRVSGIGQIRSFACGRLRKPETDLSAKVEKFGMMVDG